jgi:hypothetical protein
MRSLKPLLRWFRGRRLSPREALLPNIPPPPPPPPPPPMPWMEAQEGVRLPAPMPMPMPSIASPTVEPDTRYTLWEYREALLLSVLGLLGLNLGSLSTLRRPPSYVLYVCIAL